MRQAIFPHAITMRSALNKLYTEERHPLLRKRTFRTSSLPLLYGTLQKRIGQPRKKIQSFARIIKI